MTKAQVLRYDPKKDKRFDRLAYATFIVLCVIPSMYGLVSYLAK